MDHSFVMPNTVIKKGAVVKYSIISENCTIGENASIGVEPEDPDAVNKNICVIAKDLVIADGETITE